MIAWLNRILAFLFNLELVGSVRWRQLRALVNVPTHADVRVEGGAGMTPTANGLLQASFSVTMSVEAWQQLRLLAPEEGDARVLRDALRLAVGAVPFFADPKFSVLVVAPNEPPLALKKAER